MTDGSTSNERFADAIHFDRRHHSGLATDHLEWILQRESIDDGGKHAHVVRGRFVNQRAAIAFELSPSEDVAAPYNNGNLASQVMRVFDLHRNRLDFIHADAALSGMG
jgi:ubiquitin